MNSKSIFAPVVLLLCLLGTVVTGCGKPEYPVRSEVAMSTLQTTLDLWKSGKPITECKSLQPAVVAQDMDWMAGEKLANYKVLDQRKRDANLFVTVQLDFASEKEQRTVTYCVGTDPVLTVFRAME